MNPLTLISRLRSHLKLLAGLLVMLALADLLGERPHIVARASEQLSAGSGHSFMVSLEPIISGLVEPTTIASAGDGRLFVAQRGGSIRVIEQNGQLLPLPYLDIEDRVGSAENWEQGLIGLAFHPDYGSNGLFYVNYTDSTGDSQIARFQVSTDDPNEADASTEVSVLAVEQPTVIHNGGQLAFGPDGYLYIGLGDGGWLSDPDNNAQNMELLLGKILRLAVSTSSAPPYYSVPDDNPFAGLPDAAGEIWALGLRNPWRFSFDRLTGDMFIGDVGNFRQEEIDYEPSGSPGGANYGWRCYEGNLSHNLTDCGPPGDYAFPIHDYSHIPGCAVTGGYVYRGSQYPLMDGYYLFTDLCSGEIWSLHRDSPDGQWQAIWRGGSVLWLSTFGEAADGELYVADYYGGTIYQLTAASVVFSPLMFLNAPG
jgi:glucose/arabinose dehydrogenase